jgi:site-specific DNA recombinase
MVKSVTTIPARINKKTAMPIDSPRKRRVAAYARVSTDSEEQATSYEAQVDYYTNYIKSRNDWEFVRVYADEGITGTNTKDRVEFKAMINDALDGKIDLIITKSVSRFARNTVDTLTTVRKLKEKNIEVWFEKKTFKRSIPKASFSSLSCPLLPRKNPGLFLKTAPGDKGSDLLMGK